MNRLMVSEPWRMRRWFTILSLALPKPKAALIPAVMSLSVSGGSIFSAVLESTTVIVTRTPRGRWAVVAFDDQVPVDVKERVPLELV